MASPNKITITAQTLSGGHTDEYNVHQKLQKVVDKTFDELGIEPAPGEVWELRQGSTVLDLTTTIEGAGLSDGVVLSLAPQESGGGSWTRR